MFEKIKAFVAKFVAKANAVAQAGEQGITAALGAPLPARGIAEEAVNYIIYLFAGLFVLSVLIGALAISNTSPLYTVYTTLVGKTGEVFDILVTVIILLVVFFIIRIIRE